MQQLGIHVPFPAWIKSSHQRTLESGGEESTERPFPLPVESDSQFRTAARVPGLLLLPLESLRPEKQSVHYRESNHTIRQIIKMA